GRRARGGLDLRAHPPARARRLPAARAGPGPGRPHGHRQRPVQDVRGDRVAGGLDARPRGDHRRNPQGARLPDDRRPGAPSGGGRRGARPARELLRRAGRRVPRAPRPAVRRAGGARVRPPPPGRLVLRADRRRPPRPRRRRGGVRPSADHRDRGVGRARGVVLAAGERRAGPGEGALRVPQAPGDAARGHRPTREAPVTRAVADAGAVRRGLVLIAAIWVAVACAAAPVPPTGPPDIAFTPVALPDGAVPEVLAADGDQLLVGVHRAAAPQPPGLVRRSPDGTVTEVPAQAVTGYGRTASWFSLAADGTRILAIGGDRGGAH